MNRTNEDIYTLIAKSITEGLSEKESEELTNWKQEDPENLKEYHDLVSLWSQSASLTLPSAINQTEALERVRKRSGISSVRKRWIRLTGQAAAVLTLSLIFSGIYSYLNRPETESIQTVSSPIFQEVKSAYGTQAKVELADGTTVFLNSGSKLRFPQTFGNQSQRNVELDGEAYFSVTKNENMPFIVHTNRLNIKVLGTKFNVDAYADNQAIRVALVEGKVMLHDGASSSEDDLTDLIPNQVATFNVTDHSLSKTDVRDMNKYTAWISGRIVFFGDPIQTVMKKLEKWYNVEIVLSDKKLEKYSFTGTFIDESLEQVLNILSLTSPMTYVIQPSKKQPDNSMSKRKIILKSK